MADKTDTIKTRLSIDGEKEYKSACSNINKSLSLLNSEMKLVTAEYKNNASSAEALSAKQEILQKTYSEQAKKVEETEKQLEKAKELYGENSEEVQKYQKELNYQKAALQNTTNALKENEREQKEATSTQKSYENACKGIDQNLSILSAELKEVNAKYADNATSAKAVAEKQEILKKTYDEQAKKVAETEKAYESMKQEYGENSDEVKELEKQLHEEKAALYDVENQIKSTEKSHSDLGSTLSGVLVTGIKAVTVAVTAAVAGLSAMGAASIKVGSEFETSMAKTSTLFSGTDEEFKQLNDDILKISSSTGLAATELAEAAYSAESAGVAQEDLASMLENSAKLAAAGFTDVDTALSATAKTMNAYGEKAGTIEDIQKVLIQTQNLGITTVDELGQSLAQVTPTAASFGVSFEQVGASLAVMTASGTATATATTQLNTLIAELAKNGTTAATNLEKAAEGTEYAGMSFTEMMESGADLADVLALIQNSADESGLSMVDMFSSIEAGKAALSIMSEDGQKFKDDLAEMATQEDVVGAGYDAMMDTFENKAAVFKTTAENMGIAIYQNMQEPLKEWTDVGIDALEELQSAFSDGGFEGLISSMGGVLGDIVTKIAEQAPALVESAVKLLDGFTNAIVEQMPMIMDAAVQIGEIIIEGIIQMLPALADGAVQIILSLAQGIAEALPQLLPTLVEAVIYMAEMLIENLPLLIDAALQLITGLAEGIIAAIPVLIEALPEIITAIINALVEGIPLIIESAGDILVAIIDGIITAVPLLVEAMPQIIMAIVTGLIEGIPQILEAVGSLVTNVVTKLGELVTLIPPAISEAITKIAEWGANMQDKAKEVITLMVTKVINLAKELPTKIWNAIVSCVTKIAEWGVKMQEKAKSAISNVCTSIVNGFKDLPSKMVEIGTNVVQGIWNGINNAKDWILDKIKGFGDAVLSGLKSFFGINSPSRVMRDQVGVYLAQGIGLGFEEEMQKVTRNMQQSIPREFDIDAETDTDGWDAETDDRNQTRQQGVTVIQNIYANETNYKKQQREAAKNFRLIARTV